MKIQLWSDTGEVLAEIVNGRRHDMKPGVAVTAAWLNDEGFLIRAKLIDPDGAPW